MGYIMTKADKIEQWIIRIGAIGTAFFALRAIDAAVKRKAMADYDAKHPGGIGAIKRIKRRIYKEVSMAQDAGVDFSKKYEELTRAEIDALEHIGHELEWKQSKRSIESGKPYAESYYNSLRRAWNAVSGVQGIGRAWNVKDADGNLVLTWIEDAAAHVEHEQRVLEAEKRAAEARKRKAATNRRLTQQPSAPIVLKTKQQQLLDRFPNLKIMDDPFNPIKDSTAFTLVVWRKVKNNDGSVLYEGPAMAFTSRAAAEDAIAFMKGKINFKTDIWSEYWDYLRDKFQKEDDEYYKAVREGTIEKNPLYVSKRDMFYSREDDASLTIKDVSKINLDKISGMGALSAEDGLEPELLAFVREQVDPRRMEIAFEQIDEMRCPLSMAEPTLYNSIVDLVDEWCTDNAIDPDSVWELYDPEDIFWAL